MSKTDALLHAKENIRVSSFHPGFIWTPMVEAFSRESGDLEGGKKAAAELHPLGRIGDPEEALVASAGRDVERPVGRRASP